MSVQPTPFPGDLVPVLSGMMDGLNEQAKVGVLFNIFLGRDPDADATQYYAERMARSHAEVRAVITEIATSEEARSLGLLSSAIKLTSSSSGDDTPIALCLLAASGILFRRLTEQSAKFANIEQLAKLTLLSVPEWCGHAYDKLQSRIEQLEKKTGLS